MKTYFNVLEDRALRFQNFELFYYFIKIGQKTSNIHVHVFPIELAVFFFFFVKIGQQTEKSWQ